MMPRRRAVLGTGALALAAAGRGSAQGDALRGEQRPLPGPLRHEPGELFFTDAGSGKAVYLAGIHTWTTVQDRGPAFDWPAFLALQERCGGNLLRAWATEGPDDFSVDGPTHPVPFARATDGRYDLARFDQAFFDRVRERAIEAGRRGIYVSQMFFNGWSLQFGDEKHNPFKISPWNIRNNVNGVDGDPRGTGYGSDVQTLRDPAITAIQEAYVRRVVDALADLPHVLFEISNESANTEETWDWQDRMLDVAKRHLASRGLARPVGLTASAGWLGGRDRIAVRLAGSAADWVSPDGDRYKTDPPPADGAKVSIVDSDHVWGLGGQSVDWCWQCFTRGHNLWSMDSLKTPDIAGRPASTNTSAEQAAAEDAAREGIRQTRTAAEMVDLRGARARGDLCSTGFALADPADGDFVAYAPKGGAFVLDLSGARGKRLAARWVDTGAGAVSEAGVVEGGNASQGFAAPAGRATALVLRPVDRAARR
jgi:hypothetical protein